MFRIPDDAPYLVVVGITLQFFAYTICTFMLTNEGSTSNKFFGQIYFFRAAKMPFWVIPPILIFGFELNAFFYTVTWCISIAHDVVGSYYKFGRKMLNLPKIRCADQFMGPVIALTILLLLTLDHVPNGRIVSDSIWWTYVAVVQIDSVVNIIYVNGGIDKLSVVVIPLIGWLADLPPQFWAQYNLVLLPMFLSGKLT